jgi:hypothetical protein
MQFRYGNAVANLPNRKMKNVRGQHHGLTTYDKDRVLGL